MNKTHPQTPDLLMSIRSMCILPELLLHVNPCVTLRVCVRIVCVCVLLRFGRSTVAPIPHMCLQSTFLQRAPFIVVALHSLLSEIVKS